MKVLVFLAVSLGLVASTPIQQTHNATSEADSAEPPARQTLNEMLQEVEKLMGDTKSKLESAVKELTDQDSIKDLPANYHNETRKETKVGNATIVTKEEIYKETDNNTGSTFFSKTIVSSLKDGDKEAQKTDNNTASTFFSKTIVSSLKDRNKEGQECIVDEDCGSGRFCHLSSVNYRCLPCKEEEMCTRDGECCDGRLCVWGQCRTSSKGRSGTICENQQDCGPGLCCAVHTSLLFPVCTPLPGRGEQCQTHNPFMELFTWELESEVPVNLCPCSRGLVCQPQSPSLVSVCEDPSLVNTKRDPSETTEEDLSFTAAPQDEIVYEDGLLVPTDVGLDLGDSEDVIDRESELPQPQFIDFI